MGNSRIRVYDLVPVPVPVQKLLGKIGLDERYFITVYDLVKTPSSLLGEKKDEYSRPLEFLATSTSLFAVIAIAQSFGFEALGKTDAVSHTLKEYFVEWLIVYCTVLLISLVLMFVDLLVLGLFRDKTKENLHSIIV